jgi:Ser/Thr protein kinase RdoA (MazF antagonist)
VSAIVVDDAVARRWGWTAAACSPLAGGLINHTFRVDDAAGQPVAVLQRLHPIFGPAVLVDLDAVTRHLGARGLVTPRPLATVDGALWADVDGHVWRALSWVDGQVIAAVPAPAWAEAGGALVGRFHRAVEDLEHAYAHVRAGVHDTAAHLARLRDAVRAAPPSSARDLGAEILAAATTLPSLPALRRGGTATATSRSPT